MLAVMSSNQPNASVVPGAAPQPGSPAPSGSFSHLLTTVIGIVQSSWQLYISLTTPKNWTITGGANFGLPFLAGNATLAITFGQ